MKRAPSRRPARAWILGACLLLGVLGGCATVAGPGPDAEPVAHDSDTSVRSQAAAATATTPDSAAAATPPEATASATSPASAASANVAPPNAPSADPGPAAIPPTGIHLDAELDPERSDLWQRVRDGLGMTDLDNALVRKWERWYAERPDYVQRMTERGARYLFHIVEEVDRRGLPMELALLPFIESAFNPEAMSNARAAGMWQFMPATGQHFELRQNLFRDDRRDVLASTRAALDYLEQLYARFGDWHLALAAYNWGQGNVQRAIDRNQRSRRATDLGSLQRLPQETREYVPKLQAVENIVRRPEAFGLTLPPLENHPYFLSVPIERDIDVVLATRLAGLEMDEFRQLNPQHNKPVILAAGTPQVLLPYDAANRFVRELARHDGPLASWTAWVAPRTLKTAEAARLTGMDEERLREVNRIPPRMLVRAGSTLLVPRAAHAADDVPEQVADFASLLLAPEGAALRRISFKVGARGDSVAAVARRYRISPEQVAQWNGVAPGARFAPGRSVVVMVPVRSGRSAKPTARAAAGPAAQTAVRASASAAKPSRTQAPARAAARAQGSPGRAAVSDGRR